MPENNNKPEAYERQSKIRELLKDNEQVSISALAESFGVSEMTVRRDLEKLEVAGQIRRTRGGAIPSERMVFEFDFADRRNLHTAEKQAIAAEAFKLIEPGQRLILDTGTTTLELACLLRQSKDITVITPSLAVASVLQFSAGVQTVLLGGIVRHGSPDLTGPVAEATLDMFAVDIAFQGADGIGLDGTLYHADMRIAKVDGKIRARADRTYVLSDSSKIGQTALAINGSLRDVEALITDSAIGMDYKTAFQQMGTNVIAVKA